MCGLFELSLVYRFSLFCQWYSAGEWLCFAFGAGRVMADADAATRCISVWPHRVQVTDRHLGGFFVALNKRRQQPKQATDNGPPNN